MSLTEYHSKFAGGVRWKVTDCGVEVEGAGLVKYDNGMYARAAALCGKHVDAFAASSVKYGVPVELLMACTLTEGAAKNPETCVREEPGYLSDEKTPARISAGMCQLLISTARSIMKDPNIDRAWLFNPGNSLDACAAYIKSNHDLKSTDWDPILVACAYNAGGL
jgi:Transglycosylase SLT domain